MFVHIRRHQKWLWIFISAAVIISFVWYFNPNQQYGGGGAAGGSTGVAGMIAGEPVTVKEFNDAHREAMLHYLFSYGTWPEDNEITRQLRPIERERRNRVFLVRKVEDYGIEVSDAAVADWIAQAFSDRETRRFQPEAYERFIQGIEQRGMKREDFERYARHQVGISHLAALAGAAGKLVTPQQAEQAFRQAHEKADTRVAVVSISNFVAQVQAPTNAVAAFYTNNAFSYRLRDRVQLAYVPFMASNYLAKAEESLSGLTNLNAQIDSLYLQRGANFYTDASGQPLAPEAAKEKIREEVRMEAALREARRDAYEFATRLEKVPPSTNQMNPAQPLENLAASENLPVQATEPFTQAEGPVQPNLPAQVSRVAFSLTPEAPVILEPVTGEDGVYVMALKRRIPSETQPLEAVFPRVVQDYKRSEAQRMAREAGNSFANALKNAGGTNNFEQLAQQHGLQVVDVPPFPKEGNEPITGLPPQVDASTLRGTAFGLSPGETSGYLPSRDGGFVVEVQNFIPVSGEELKTDLPQFVEELRRRGAAEAFNDWFAREMQLAQMVLAGDEEETAIQ